MCMTGFDLTSEGVRERPPCQLLEGITAALKGVGKNVLSMGHSEDGEMYIHISDHPWQTDPTMVVYQNSEGVVEVGTANGDIIAE